MLGRVADHDEAAMGDDLVALAVAGVTMIALLVALIVAGLHTPPVD